MLCKQSEQINYQSFEHIEQILKHIRETLEKQMPDQSLKHYLEQIINLHIYDK